MPPNNVEPKKLPAMRCYLGESSSYQYGGKVKKPELKTWLTKLVSELFLACLFCTCSSHPVITRSLMSCKNFNAAH